MIDNDFKVLYGINLTRDQRDLKFKDSIKKFMESLNEHDHVIMIISDSYLKSNNCMYEVMEVMRDRKYTNKIFYIILNENDKKYYKESSLEKIYAKGKTVGCNIYSLSERIEYTKYWSKEYDNISNSIEELDEFSKIQYVAELKQIRNIKENIGEFITTISDLKNESLEELKFTNYELFAKNMNLKRHIK